MKMEKKNSAAAFLSLLPSVLRREKLVISSVLFFERSFPLFAVSKLSPPSTRHRFFLAPSTPHPPSLSRFLCPGARSRTNVTRALAWSWRGTFIFLTSTTFPPPHTLKALVHK